MSLRSALLLVTTVMTLELSAKEKAPIDRFFDEYYFRLNPTAATSAGFHEYDGELEDYSKAAVGKRLAMLKKFETEIATMAPSSERDLVLARIHADQLEYQTVRSWERNPDIYSSGVSGSIFAIMSRNFASQEERLNSVIARERRIPQVFADARANLANPPKIYTEVAIEQIPGIIGFFEKDVPAAFAKVTDPKLLADFKASNQAVIDSLTAYGKFLKEQVLPRSHGDFRIGAKTFAQKLAYEEMVDIPLDRLLQIGYENLRANQKAYRETLRKIDPNKKPEDVIAEIEKDYPEPSKLLDAFRATLGGLRDFITEHHIATIPSPVLPILEETPAFARALTFASMDTPGPYENVAKEAYFNVTLPEKDWDANRVAGFMGAFNRGVILSTAIHEAYPGHYVQFLWVQKVQSKIRKLLGCNSNAEGWAHYTEQMMLDEGYTSDPKMRLGQLQDALLRNARYIVGLEMHTGKMTFEQGVEFFVKEGFQTRATGERETRRGTSDPTYLVYTLGKLQILKLRDDYKAKMGAKFSLQEFHDRFLQQGFPPIKIVRRELLGDDSPAL